MLEDAPLQTTPVVLVQLHGTVYITTTPHNLCKLKHVKQTGVHTQGAMWTIKVTGTTIRGDHMGATNSESVSQQE